MVTQEQEEHRDNQCDHTNSLPRAVQTDAGVEGVCIGVASSVDTTVQNTSQREFPSGINGIGLPGFSFLFCVTFVALAIAAQTGMVHYTFEPILSTSPAVIYWGCLAVWPVVQLPLKKVSGLRAFISILNLVYHTWVTNGIFLNTPLLIMIAVYASPLVAIVWLIEWLLPWEYTRLTSSLLIVFLAGVLWVRPLSQKADTSSPITGVRACVIGSGLAGLVAAKELIAEGCSVVVFERNSTYGGVWADTGISRRAEGHTLFTASRQSVWFSDFPMPSWSNQEFPTHCTADEYHAYLAAYVEKFRLLDVIQLDSEVLSVSRQENTWTVKTTQGVQQFDYVVAANGLHQHKTTSVLTGKSAKTSVKAREEVKAQTMPGLDPMSVDYSVNHTTDERCHDPESFRDQHVCVIGMGESSSDFIQKVAPFAAHVSVIIRSPVAINARKHDLTQAGVEYAAGKFIMLMVPAWVRKYLYLPQLLIWGPSNYLREEILGFSKLNGTACNIQQRSDIWSQQWWRLNVATRLLHPNKKFMNDGWDMLHVKSAGFVPYLETGKVSIHLQAVETFDQSSLQLAKGQRSIDDVDALVLATGFIQTFPFLPTPLCDQPFRDHYHLIFPAQEPNIAFVGFIRPYVGSIMESAEMSARWVAMVASGRRKLPSPAEMEAEIKIHKARYFRFYASSSSSQFASHIARHKLGCFPDLEEVVSNKPIHLWNMINTVACGTMFRYTGNSVNRRVFSQVFDNMISVQPFEMILNLLLMVFAIITNVYSRILWLFGFRHTFLNEMFDPVIDKPFGENA